MTQFVLSCTRLSGLAAVLGLLLACQTPPPMDDRPSGDGHGMLTTYTVRLRYFSDSEAQTVVRAMTNFPGYRSHDLMSSSGAVRHYSYVSTAKAFKLEEWLYTVFRRMRLDSERDVLVQVDGAQIIVDRLVPRSERDQSRFS